MPSPKRSASPRAISTLTLDSLKALDPNRPIREADIVHSGRNVRFVPKADNDSAITSSARASSVAVDQSDEMWQIYLAARIHRIGRLSALR